MSRKSLYNKKTQKAVWIVLAILIMPAFVFWGLGSISRDKRQPDYVGKIFGRKVPYPEYKDALDATRNFAILQFGESFYQISKYMNLEYQAWERLILLTEAKKRKIKVSNQEVIDTLASYPLFQKNGEFDQKTYAGALQYVFHTQPREFEEQIRKSLMIAKLYEQVTLPIEVSEEELRDAYIKENSKASIYYLAALTQDFKPKEMPSQEELTKYFEANKEAFRTRLSFNLEYIASESKEQIEKILPLLNKKASLEELSSDFKLPIKETGLFALGDDIPGLGDIQQISAILPRLSKGGMLPPFQIDDKYCVLRVKEVVEPHIPEFKDIEEKITERFNAKSAADTAKSRIEECRKELMENFPSAAETANLEKAARKFSLKYGTAEGFGYSDKSEELGSMQEFFEEAAKLKDTELSGVVSAANGYYLIQLKSFDGIDEKQFSEEKEEFSRKILDNKQQRFFNIFTQELTRRAQKL